jgi:hypothetical protein
MNYNDARHRKVHEHLVVLLVRIIEVRGGDDDATLTVSSKRL